IAIVYEMIVAAVFDIHPEIKKVAREIPAKKKNGLLGKIDIKNIEIFLASPDTSIAFAMKKDPRNKKIRWFP
ncbi:MAG: hypothetical protein ABIM85_02880, partial [candidate division WOR-3 bacterium]